MTFDTWYTTISHNLLIKVFSEIRNLVFKSTTRSRIGLSKKSVYRASKGCARKYLIRKRLINAISFLVVKCCFTFGNKCSNKTLTCDIDMWHWHVTLTCDIDIPMVTDAVPYWANVWIPKCSAAIIWRISSACNFIGTSRFKFDLCTINDDGEFSSSHKYIYPEEW